MELILGIILFFGSFIALIMLQMKKRAEKKKKKNMDTGMIEKNNRDLLPHIHYDSENHCFVDSSNNHCFDFIRICSKDLVNASEDEISYDQNRFTKLYKIYADDIKIIAMNFPCSTINQQQYIKKKINGTKNQKRIYWLKKRLAELEWLEKNRTTREYYFMILANGLDTFLADKNHLFSCLHTGKNGMVEEVTFNEKVQILFKMNNKSSQVN